MTNNLFQASLTLIFLLLLSACNSSDDSQKTLSKDTPNTQIEQTAAIAVEYKEIEWAELIPENYRPDEVLDEYMTKYKLDELEDSDPIIIELQEKLRELLASAPVNENMSGQTIKLAGYLLPLESDGMTTSEFLLVPYFGACIHVPPPPANQTIYVKTDTPIETEGLFDAVWVSGEINVEHKVSEYADAGYTMSAKIVSNYEPPEELPIE